MDSKTVMVEPNDEDGGRRLTHKRDVFRAWMFDGLDFSRPWDMPRLSAADAHPTALVPFSVAMHERWDDYGCFAHFFEDDFRFESDDPVATARDLYDRATQGGQDHDV